MSARPLSIAQISTSDEGGGAAAVASGLMRGYTSRGHRVWTFVGRTRGSDPAVVPLADDDRAPYRATGYTAVQRALRSLAARHPDRGFGLASRTLRLATHPRALADRLRGREDFEFAGSRGVLDRLSPAPDIVHGHNLHGGYFDLRAIAPISRRVPTVLTLHDMWLMTGHCAHALRCDRWQSGCGACPDLHLDPAIRRDATRENWQRKREVFEQSALHLATPSAWLRDQVGRSMLAPHMRECRVIPNGVDVATFHPGERQAARAALDLPSDVRIVLLTTGSLGSMWKDDRTLHRVMAALAERRDPAATLFVAVGRDSAAASRGAARTQAIPFVHEPAVMADYYRAADVYLHAARADTFPLAVLEAMACGTPVIATATGGIPEQIVPAGLAALRRQEIGAATGVLVPQGDAIEMTDALDLLLSDDDARARLGRNAAAAVLERFTLARQVDAYLAWYRELVQE